MKNVLALLALGVLVFAVQGCSDDPPQLRVRNDFTKKANVHLKPPAGNTININDVDWGGVSAYQDVSETSWTATATLQGESEAPSTVLSTKNNYRYTLVITNTTPPTLRVDSEDR